MADYAKRPEVTISTMVRPQATAQPYQQGHCRPDLSALRIENFERAKQHEEHPNTDLPHTFFDFSVCFLYYHANQLQGKVHNPSGQGVRAVSSQVQAKALKHSNGGTEQSATTDAPPVAVIGGHGHMDDHDTKTKEGTAKRNIVRKKTDPRDTGNYDSRNKKQGGHGKGKWKEDIIYDDDVEPLDEKDPLFDETKELP